MSDDVQFGDESAAALQNRTFNAPEHVLSSSGPSLINFVKKIKLAKTDRQAQIVLVIVAFICISLSIYLIASFIFDVGPKKRARYVVPPHILAQFPADIRQRVIADQANQ
jgi:hypothetical protein